MLPAGPHRRQAKLRTWTPFVAIELRMPAFDPNRSATAEPSKDRYAAKADVGLRLLNGCFRPLCVAPNYV